MGDEAPNEPLFRASKRRKILRKRTGSDSSPQPPPAAEDVADEVAAPITKHATESEDGSAGVVLRLQKKSVVRKRGIAFSSVDNRRYPEQEQNEETAVGPARQDEAQDVAQNDRFVRPTGRVGLTEDKHMYVPVYRRAALARNSTNSVGLHM